MTVDGSSPLAADDCWEEVASSFLPCFRFLLLPALVAARFADIVSEYLSSNSLSLSEYSGSSILGGIRMIISREGNDRGGGRPLMNESADNHYKIEKGQQLTFDGRELGLETAV